jgi:hypothetical protein
MPAAQDFGSRFAFAGDDPLRAMAGTYRAAAEVARGSVPRVKA